MVSFFLLKSSNHIYTSYINHDIIKEKFKAKGLQ